MTQVEILEELRKLPAAERLKIVEAALQLIREDLQQIEQSTVYSQKKRQLSMATEALRPDYLAGGELTALSSI